MYNPNSTKVIIFSNDSVFIEIIKRIIEKMSHQGICEVRTSFSDASNINNVDLIITDNKVTGRTSYELVSFLRQQLGGATPIVYFGVPEYGGEEKSLLAGATKFFAKPFETKDIEEELSNILTVSKELV